MAAFDFVALDAHGKQRKGTVEGDSARQVRSNLREKGMTPLTVEETSKKGIKGKSGDENGGRSAGSRYKVKSLDLAVITRQMATLIQAGLPVEEALRAIARQCEKPKTQSMMIAIRAKVLEGFSLARSLESYPRSFPQLFRATVAAGEHSGHLELVLDQLADYTESSHETSRKVQGALIYPVVLVMFSILIVVGLLHFVMPKMVSVLEGSGQELPGLTQALIGLSDFIGSYGLVVFFLLVLCVWGFNQALKKPPIRLVWDRWLLALPLLGRPIGNAVRTATTAVREGASLNRALDQSGFFPPLMIQMIASGESSGELDTMLSRAAVAQERELDNMITTIIGLFEPLMLVFMGVIVLTIVLAIMMPVFKMSELAG
ncbi:MAG: type II secretion system F family protein [Gammaproteobacteria bacterium]